MKIKTVLGLAVILTLAFALAARYRNTRNLPADFRDAVKSEGAAEQLQKAALADRASIPAPQAVEPAAVQSPGSGDTAGQRVKREYSENNPLHKRLAEALGINYPCTVETMRLGAWYQLAEKLTLDDGRRKESVVVKKAGTSFVRFAGNFIWKVYMEITSASKLKEEADSVKMLRNGVAMNEKFKAAGLKVLEIVLADPENTFVVTKFLKGTGLAAVLEAALRGDAGAMQNIKQVGSALATAHRNNFSVGDLNLGNVIFANGEPYFIDVDRATVGGAKGWDIALFFYHPILTGGVAGEPEAWALVARSFLQSYLAGGGEAGVIKDALSRKYIAPFSATYAVKGRSLTHAVRREMKKAVSEDLSQDREEALGLAESR